MTDQPRITSAFHAAFLAAADPGGTMRFDRFMELALYHPKLGYYRGDRSRIGFKEGSDFFTSTTSDPVFGELVVAACVDLLGSRSPADYTFVEIGAETSIGVLEHVSHPFASARTCRLGQPLGLSGRCVVFSNELFDAQPFRRFVARSGSWAEYHVQLCGTSLNLIEVNGDAPSELPPEWPDGYIIDAPLAAAGLTKSIAAQPWSGLFLACDYGKSWRELTEACPHGTARAYFRHQQSNDLLARPGEQDLTCHVCWDWISTELHTRGFLQPELKSQESFFVRHAAKSVEAIIAAEAAQFSRRKASLLQLLHPSHHGQKFQVLHALRD